MLYGQPYYLRRCWKSSNDKCKLIVDTCAACFFFCVQGSTVIYATLAALPEMNEKVSVVMHMGPVAFLDFFRAPFLRAYGLVRNDKVSSSLALPQFILRLSSGQDNL